MSFRRHARPGGLVQMAVYAHFPASSDPMKRRAKGASEPTSEHDARHASAADPDFRARTHSLLTEADVAGRRALPRSIRDQLIVGESGTMIGFVCRPCRCMLDPQARIAPAVSSCTNCYESPVNMRALSDPRGKLSIKWMVRTNRERELLLVAGSVTVGLSVRKGAVSGTNS